MKVSRVEIFGFKSFMDRLVLPLESGITGVVGPNGCGKSNIVDAVRWILGETRARNLRGGILEDIIFNGTDKLRPLGLAEVTLTIKSDGEDFFQDLKSPALEAELIAEGADQLLVEEVKDSESSEEQGEGEEVVEADNIIKLEDRELNYNTNVSTSASLLEKYSWLKAASEVQVTRRLYRSGESEFFLNRVPCRLKDLKDFFRAIGLSAKGFTIVAQGEISRVITAKPEERRRLLEEAAGVQGFRDRINATRSRLNETFQNLSRIEDIIKEVSRQVGTLKRQANRARSREDLKAEIKRLDTLIYRHRLQSLSGEKGVSDSGLDQVKSREQELEEKFQTEKNNEANVRAQVMEIDIESDELRSKIDSARDNLSQRVSKRAARSSRLSEVKAFITATESEIEKIAAQEKQVGEREASIQTEIRQFVEEEGKLSSELKQIELEQEEKLAKLQEEINSLRASIENKDDDLRTTREAYVSKETQYNALKEQLAALSSKEQLQESAANLPTLLDCLEIEEGYSIAVESVLQEKATFLVAEDPHALAKDVLGNSNVSVFGALKSRPSANVSNASCSLMALKNYVSAKPGNEALVDSLFSSVYLVDSVSEGVEFLNSHSEAVILVTKNGQVLSHDSVYYNSSGRISNVRKEIEKLSTEVAELNEQVAKQGEEKNQLITQLKSQEDSYQELQANAQTKQAQARELGGSLGALQGQRQSAEKSLKQFQDDRALHQQALETAQTSFQSLTSELDQLKTEDVTDDEADDNQFKEEITKLNEAYEETEKRRLAAREELNKFMEILDSIRGDLDQARMEVSEATLSQQRFELELNNLKERILEDYGDEYLEECLQNLNDSVLIEDSEYDEQSSELQKLKSKLAREGEIDPESIERYEEENARLEDLEKQKEDLVSASKSIEETLERLVDTSEKRFMETFSQVADNYSKLVPKLFGGGKGSLALSDPDNPLESGLDIIVRPPGKKLKSIDLLSGGEKALCATALIVSMFLVRPSPLCILDEVDAPLDDANLARFLGVIKEMSKQETQFVLITHNKQSMAVADNLVGVTMQQPGATTVISVSLEEAYEQVA